MDERSPCTSVNLSQVKHCDQVWKYMPLVPGGRHCQRCSKRIVDFSGMNRSELARVHRESDAPVCGMYRADQLRPPSVPRRNASWWNAPRPFVSLISMLLLEPALSTSMAQESPTEQISDPTIQDQDPAARERLEERVIVEQVVIRGSVWEQHGKERKSLPFVDIHVKGTDIFTRTDFDGSFVLDLSELPDTLRSVVLVMSYIGYVRMEHVVALNNSEKVEFVVTEQDLNATVYAVEYRRPPLHRRIWKGLQRPFRK